MKCPPSDFELVAVQTPHIRNHPSRTFTSKRLASGTFEIISLRCGDKLFHALPNVDWLTVHILLMELLLANSAEWQRARHWLYGNKQSTGIVKTNPEFSGFLTRFCFSKKTIFAIWHKKNPWLCTHFPKNIPESEVKQKTIRKFRQTLEARKDPKLNCIFLVERVQNVESDLRISIL